jgi:hypothetical protein
MSNRHVSKLRISKFCLACGLVFAFAIAITPVLLHAAAAPAPAVIGNWEGSISAGEQSLRLVIHVTQDKDGGLTGTMDSLDQGANGIPLNNVSFKDPKVHYEIGGTYPGFYDGSYDKAKDEISGHWQQAGQDLTLNLKRAK